MRFDKTVSPFFDELEKISSDLMTPAVSAESNTVEGPPASPFMKRKGYKKLENASALAKEAGFKEIVDTIKGGLKKGVDKINLQIAHLYHRPGRSGKIIRAVAHDMAENPGSYGNIGSINPASIIKKGAASRRGRS